MTTPQKFKKLLSNIQLDIIKAGRGVKLVNNKEQLAFTTGILCLPFGLKSEKRDWSPHMEYYMDAFVVEDEQIDYFTKLDQHIKHIIEAKRDMLKIIEDVPDIRPVLRENTFRENTNYILKLNLKRDNNGNFTSFMFNDGPDNELVKLKVTEANINEYLKKGVSFKATIECTKIWYFKGKVGSSWAVNQLRFCKQSTKEEPPERPEGEEEVDFTQNLFSS